MSEYEVLAIRFGSWLTTRGHCYYRFRTYGEPDGDLRMDFFFWLVRGNGLTMLVDAGYSQAAVDTRPGRERFIGARDALRELGVDPDSVTHILVTHLHYDHTGNLPEFPTARLILQAAELDFWNSRYVRQAPLATSAEPAELTYVREKLARGEVDLLEGDAEVFPGVHAVLLPGHTPGQQIVVVDRATPVVIASDALHYYEEMDRDRIFDIFTDLRQMYDGYERLRQMRAAGMTIVAGHDPAVLERFETIATSADGPLALRLA